MKNKLTANPDKIPLFVVMQAGKRMKNKLTAGPNKIPLLKIAFIV